MKREPSLRTQMEMARGRGAVEHAMFLSEIMAIAQRLQKMSDHKMTVAPVFGQDDPSEWKIKFKLVRVANNLEPRQPETLLLEVTEDRSVFPSDELITKIMLVG